jgi:hypothetical protein
MLKEANLPGPKFAKRVPCPAMESLRPIMLPGAEPFLGGGRHVVAALIRLDMSPSTSLGRGCRREFRQSGCRKLHIGLTLVEKKIIKLWY